MTRRTDDTEWEAGWDGHQRAQQRRLAELPLWEKLAWLEEAQRVAWRLGRERLDAEPAGLPRGTPAG